MTVINKFFFPFFLLNKMKSRMKPSQKNKDSNQPDNFINKLEKTLIYLKSF